MILDESDQASEGAELKILVFGGTRRRRRERAGEQRIVEHGAHERFRVDELAATPGIAPTRFEDWLTSRSPSKRLSPIGGLMKSTASTLSSASNGRSRPSTTLAQYLEAVQVAMRERRGLRRGQAFFNVLLELEPELAHRLEETADDPFSNDGNLPGFLLRVGESLRE